MKSKGECGKGMLSETEDLERGRTCASERWGAGGLVGWGWGAVRPQAQEAAWPVPGREAAAYLAFACFQWRPFEANYRFSSGGSSSKGPLIALWKPN